jgi:hypothetical protein
VEALVIVGIWERSPPRINARRKVMLICDLRPVIRRRSRDYSQPKALQS